MLIIEGYFGQYGNVGKVMVENTPLKNKCFYCKNRILHSLKVTCKNKSEK
jgi:hypothetical protein